MVNGGKEIDVDDRIVMVIFGDNENLKKVVLDLIYDVGFDVVDVGILFELWRY